MSQFSKIVIRLKDPTLYYHKYLSLWLGGEYTSNNFTTLLTSNGTIHQTSCIDIPHQNGVVERKHCHLVENARSFLLFVYVPSVFYEEAILTSTYVVNRIRTSHNFGLSPFENLYGHAPYYSTLRVFGCTYFVLKPHVGIWS